MTLPLAAVVPSKHPWVLGVYEPKLSEKSLTVHGNHTKTMGSSKIEGGGGGTYTETNTYSGHVVYM